MDAWWNPAVGDQASDRAHRMGQTRRVTIYRLVVKGTIEEKIVDLYTHKRDLADGLLEGTDAGIRLSMDVPTRQEISGWADWISLGIWVIASPISSRFRSMASKITVFSMKPV